MYTFPIHNLVLFHEGQKAKLSVSSFPPGEYGYLQSKVLSIGADSLTSSSDVPSGTPANSYPIQLSIDT